MRQWKHYEWVEIDLAALHWFDVVKPSFRSDQKKPDFSLRGIQPNDLENLQAARISLLKADVMRAGFDPKSTFLTDLKGDRGQHRGGSF